MIDHLGINCADYAKAQEFYDRVLGVLGYSRQMDFGEAIGYGTEGHPDFWIAEGVGAFHDAAIELGANPPAQTGGAPSTLRDYGRNTTPATLRPSSETPMATTSKPSATRRVDGYG
jgi:catechol 2,3-dioxygenase-like lactoylglutathione lyase family enzyme